MSPDAWILRRLRQNSSTAASDLASAAGLSERELNTRIAELRALGYDIASTPHQGFRLIAS
ncbi:MAG TPA: HTH domain-containing protein, partial [Candidatus Acidoferrum sp.]|nr:HTH domain-containing protein [Candidatus Acidoferrum sp.]